MIGRLYYPKPDTVGAIDRTRCIVCRKALSGGRIVQNNGAPHEVVGTLVPPTLRCGYMNGEMVKWIADAVSLVRGECHYQISIGASLKAWIFTVGSGQRSAWAAPSTPKGNI